MYLMVLEVLEGWGLSAVKIIRKIITIISILELLSMPFGMLKDDPPEPQPPPPPPPPKFSCHVTQLTTVWIISACVQF